MIKQGYTVLSTLWNILRDERGEVGEKSNTDVPPALSTEDVSELQAFRDLGWSANDIALALQDYGRLVNEAKSKGADKPTKEEKPAKDDDDDEIDLSQIDPKVRKQLVKMFPGIDRLDKVKELEERQRQQDEEIKRSQQSTFSDTQTQARKDVLYYYTDVLGGDTTTEQGREVINTVLSMVSQYVGSDSTLLERFLTGDKSVTPYALKQMEKEGMFKFLNVPSAKKSGKLLPGMFGHDGDAEHIKGIAEANSEKYSKLSPSARWREMAKDVYSNVWKEG